MATCNVAARKNGVQHLNYVLHDQCHSPDEYVTQRNLIVSDTVPFAEKLFRQRFADTNGSVQVYDIRQSFSDRELDYTNPADRELCNKAGLALAEAINEQLRKKYHTTRPVIVATQADGQGHKLHNHILILNPDRNHKSIPKGLSWFKIADLNDQVTRKILGPRAVEQSTLHNNKMIRDSLSLKEGVNKGTPGHFRRSKRNRDKLSDKEKESLRNDFKDVLRQAQSQQELMRMLRNRDIQIRLRHREKEFNWKNKKTGKFKKSMTLYRAGVTVRSFSIVNKTLEQINEQLKQNKLRKQRQQREEARISSSVITNAKVDPGVEQKLKQQKQQFILRNLPKSHDSREQRVKIAVYKLSIYLEKSANRAKFMQQAGLKKQQIAMIEQQITQRQAEQQSWRAVQATAHERERQKVKELSL